MIGPVEKAYAYGGAIAGALAPIVALRYTLFNMGAGDLKSELYSWGASVLFNSIPFVGLPTFVHGGTWGLAIGIKLAENRIHKNFDKNNLEGKLENENTN